MSKEEKISYSVVAGELRKIFRNYEMFKMAAEAAAVLANYEKEIKVLKKTVSDLTSERDSLDEACDISVTKQKDAERAVNDALKKEKDIIKDANVRADNIIKEAMQKAENIVNKVNAQTKDANIQLNVLRNECVILENKKKDIEMSISESEIKLNKFKEELLNSIRT